MTKSNWYCLHWTLLHLILSSLVNLVFWWLFFTRFQFFSYSTTACIFVTPYSNFTKLCNNCSTSSWSCVATCLPSSSNSAFPKWNHHFLQQTCSSFCILFSSVRSSFQATIQTQGCFSWIFPPPRPHTKCLTNFLFIPKLLHYVPHSSPSVIAFPEASSALVWAIAITS